MSEQQQQGEMTPEEAELHLLFRGYGVSKEPLALDPVPGCVVNYLIAGSREWRVMGKGDIIPAGSRIRLTPTKDAVSGNRQERRQKAAEINRLMRVKR